MEARASVKMVRISPRKVGVVCNLIRGKDVSEAAAILVNTRKAASEPLIKLLKSAIANAQNNFEMDVDKLFVSEVLVGPGPTMKRLMPRARGSADRILKRTSNITLALSERE